MPLKRLLALLLSAALLLPALYACSEQTEESGDVSRSAGTDADALAQVQHYLDYYKEHPFTSYREVVAVYALGVSFDGYDFSALEPDEKAGTGEKAGAAIAHLHMRDDEGHGTMDKEKFRKTVELLRANHPDCDIILNMTTSGDIHADDTTRQIHLKELRPEMGSYDCGSMNWLHTSLFLNPPAFLEELGKNMQEWGVKPEIEAFDPGMIANAAYYLKKGVLKGPLHFQFCMGCANGIAACGLIELAKAIQDEAPEAAESYMNAARALLRALDEHCADWTEKTPAVLTHCTSAYHDEAGHHIAMDYGDYFFIEGVRKLAGETRLFWKPLDFAK